MTTVTTERLAGRRLGPRDLDALCALHADPAVMATLGGVRSEAQTRAYLAENLAHWDRYGYGLWMFELRTDGRFVGRGGLRHVTIEGEPAVEVTYAVMAAFWGTGLATEMARASVELGFDHLRLTELVAFAYPHNAASRRVMEKVGFRYERHIMHHDTGNVLYRLTREARA